ncbi:MAG: hypothetical protein ISR70_01620 [Candidatus Thioglobus sp.]|nr:hypothetical protein [Candidatus Thioglobus pontius]MBL6976740.1 hypothetical protein [Candidatus Thioglobus sp.]MBL6984382.1 hypothetical protein [Candidatus Thioglobus sp.]
MTEKHSFKLQASKLYFGLSLIVHLCTLFVVWAYQHNLYTSLILSLILIIHFQYLNRSIFLQTPDSILDFSLENQQLITTNKLGEKQEYPHVYCAYQSRFLVIIVAKKRPLIVFRDALTGHSLSHLNRLLNART